jgi:hypothetical protein
MAVGDAFANASRGKMKKLIKENSSVILSVAAGVGTLTTAYFAAQAGYRSAQILSNQDPHEDVRKKAKRVWRLYIPAGISATATIVCVAGVKHVDARKTLAAQTALAVSQRAYEGYRAQVIEELGERKDRELLGKVAEKRVADSPPPAIVLGSGSVLCCELWTMRYFNSDMQTLNKAVNEINAMLLSQDYVTLDQLYYILGLENTMVSGQAGWETPKLLEFEYSTILHDGKPCLAFSYNYVNTL